MLCHVKTIPAVVMNPETAQRMTRRGERYIVVRYAVASSSRGPDRLSVSPALLTAIRWWTDTTTILGIETS